MHDHLQNLQFGSQLSQRACDGERTQFLGSCAVVSTQRQYHSDTWRSMVTRRILGSVIPELYVSTELLAAPPSSWANLRRRLSSISCKPRACSARLADCARRRTCTLDACGLAWLVSCRRAFHAQRWCMRAELMRRDARWLRRKRRPPLRRCKQSSTRAAREAARAALRQVNPVHHRSRKRVAPAVARRVTPGARCGGAGSRRWRALSGFGGAGDARLCGGVGGCDGFVSASASVRAGIL